MVQQSDNRMSVCSAGAIELSRLANLIIHLHVMHSWKEPKCMAALKAILFEEVAAFEAAQESDLTEGDRDEVRRILSPRIHEGC